ncbi:MAG: hypothetical protein EZS28_050630, partial [Streblomastix strix]
NQYVDSSDQTSDLSTSTILRPFYTGDSQSNLIRAILFIRLYDPQSWSNLLSWYYQDLSSIVWEDLRLVEVSFISTDLPTLKDQDLFSVLLNYSRSSLMEIVPIPKIDMNTLGQVSRSDYVHLFSFALSQYVTSLERFERLPEML